MKMNKYVLYCCHLFTGPGLAKTQHHKIVKKKTFVAKPEQVPTALAATCMTVN